MNWFLQAVLAAAVFAAIGFLANLFVFSNGNDEDDSPQPFILAVVVFFLLLIVNGIALYWVFPAQTGTVFGQNWLWVDALLALVASGLFMMTSSYEQHTIYRRRSNTYYATINSTVVYAIVLVVIVGWIFVGVAVSAGGQGNADRLTGILQVEEAEAGDYPDTDPAHIVQVNAEIADFKANQFIAAGPQFEGRNLESVLEPGDPVLQAVDGHLYWVVDLDFIGYRTAGQISNTIPGYIVIDAEDPDARPVLRDEFRMRHVPSGYWGENLHRHLYTQGYEDVLIDDLTIEVDDDWQPYYTVALSRPLLAGINSGVRPIDFLVIDPVSGEIQEFSAGDVPDWVDRVYSANTVTNLLSYWGQWSQADWQLIQARGNRFDVAGEPGLVYTNENRAVWQVLMTSKNADTSASMVILVDAKTGEATRYSTRDGISIESNVVEVMRNAAENLKNHAPVNPQLYRIYGELAWVATYIPSDDDPDTASFAGIGIVQATSADAADVAYSDDSLTGSLRTFRRKVAGADSADDPNQEGRTETIEGVVERVGSAVEDGDTVFYVQLENDDRTYIGKVGEENTLLPFSTPGVQVRITYLDVGNPNMEVDITTYEEVGNK